MRHVSVRGMQPVHGTLPAGMAASLVLIITAFLRLLVRADRTD